MFSSDTTQVSDGGYQISRSLRFNSADSAFLDRTPASSGNRKIWTWSGWVKKTVVGDGRYPALFGAVNSTRDVLRFNGESLNLFFNNTTSANLVTTAVYRDVSAWYHVVLAVDTTQATDTNRVKLYVNGVQVTSFSTASYPAQNYDTFVNMNVVQRIGNDSNLSDGYYNGYMTEVNFIDGQAITPSSFGETNAQTGVWQPKAYSGSYGTNGFYLNFSDNSNTTAATLGKDYSGNGNNWTPNNFSVTAGAGNDSLVDSPTSYGTDTGVGGTVRGNYATLNPLQNGMGNAPTNGNLQIAGSADIYRSIFNTIGVSSGKWYFEVVITSGSGVTNVAWSSSTDIYQYAGSASTSYGYELENGNKINNGSTSAYGSALTTNDVFMCAADMDNLKLFFGKNGTWFASSDPVAGTSPAYTFAAGTYFFQMRPYTGSSSVVTTNFGQRPFAYTAPSGYKALCTQNLPTPTIGATSTTLATQFFAPVLYTGTGATQSVTIGFQPDLVWGKNRTSAVNHGLIDSVRGVSRWLGSNVSDAEGYSAGFYVTAFNTSGFTVGDGSVFNTNGNAYVAWNWKANGSGSTNTAGSITSTVSANTTSGFSVVTYTGTGTAGTIGHGLGTAPSMLIFKSRSNGSENWNVYHKSLGASTNILLNSTIAAFTDAAFLNATAPTSTVLSVGGAGASGTNQGSGTYVCYAFAEVAGYSKFGSYTGNGSTNFIYTGFRPAYVLIRRTNIAAGWGILDSARNSFNSANKSINANVSDAEGVGTAGSQYVDLLSNGFKCLDSSAGFNASGDTYIYMAFAESTFKYSLAR